MNFYKQHKSENNYFYLRVRKNISKYESIWKIVKKLQLEMTILRSRKHGFLEEQINNEQQDDEDEESYWQFD